jgi:hypothetical protein
MHPVEIKLAMSSWSFANILYLFVFLGSATLDLRQKIFIRNYGESLQMNSFLTLFYTRGLEIVVLHVMVPQPYRFSPCFLT